MPKNDYICLACSRQCEMCAFLKWICESMPRDKVDLETESITGYGRSERILRRGGWLLNPDSIQH